MSHTDIPPDNLLESKLEVWRVCFPDSALGRDHAKITVITEAAPQAELGPTLAEQRGPSENTSRHITVNALADYGLAPQEIQPRYPWAVAYGGLDGRTCWQLVDLACPLLEEGATQ
jgi:hypothetical protein